MASEMLRRQVAVIVAMGTPRGTRSKGCDRKAAPGRLGLRTPKLRKGSRPSALAVIRLMTRSNLVGCSTGKSAGFAPRKILST